MINIRKGSIKKTVSKKRFEKIYSKFGWIEVIDAPKPLEQVAPKEEPEEIEEQVAPKEEKPKIKKSKK